MHRTFVIPDIHGCSRTFRALLRQIGLLPEDTLYLLGDYIDRGPDSKGVITEILARLSAGFDIRPIMGNHEDMLLNSIDSGRNEELLLWQGNGGNATLKSYGVQHPADIVMEHIEFIRKLPMYQLSDTYVFVHAGLNFRLKAPLSPKGRDAMLWQRSVKVDLNKTGGRFVVSGHSILQMDRIKKSLSSSFIRLDNGCFTRGRNPGTGSLVALELETNELHVRKYTG